VETAAEIVGKELLTESVKNPKGGRPRKTNSEEKVAERIGVPQQTINLAKQHVAAVERHRRAEVMAEAIEHERAKGWQNLSDDEQREAQAAYAAFWRLWKLAGEDVFPRPAAVRRLVPVLLEIIEPYERAMDELFKPHEREIESEEASLNRLASFFILKA
jgi:hypothetical protein